MLDSFLTFINQQGWDLRSAPTIVTVSGGIDSVVLLRLFYKAGFPAVVAHCNFQMRGDESDADEDFVSNLSEKYGYPVYVRRFETNAYKESAGVSTQMAARDLRYAWFLDLRLSLNASFVATAHHAGDLVETVLLNLVRGTGLAGLQGIRAGNGHLIRPLLFATREEIEAFAKQEGLHWREDRSNASDVYLRNRLRHHVVPVLREMNPSLEQTFLKNTERVAAADRLLSAQLTEWKTKWVKENDVETSIDRGALAAYSEPAYALWYVLRHGGFTYEQAAEIVSRLDGLSGRVFESATHQLLIDRTHLVVRPKPIMKKEEILIINGPGSYILDDSILTITETLRPEIFERELSEAWFDAISVQFPLNVRRWKVGDRIQPFGMGGKSKLVSDVLTDAKLSVFAKEEVKVLEDSTGLILWLIGIRTSHQAAITTRTTQVLHTQIRRAMSTVY